MAWIVLDLDQTLIQPGGDLDPMTGQPTPEMPVDGAPESCMQLANEGHRLTVYTSRFAPMPDSEKYRLKTQIEEELASYGFPPMEVWAGTTKPDADIFIGHNHVTYDGDWNLALAQTEMMLSEMGLSQQAPTMEDPNAGGMEQSGESEQPEQPEHAADADEPDEAGGQ